MPSPLVFNVQRFSLHDGPGIRTTVFFKGCPLRCAWCHNPESQRFEREEITRPWLCRKCGHCAEGCAHGAREMVGAAHSVDSLTRTLLRDRQLYDTSGGGVTMSGGEPVAQDSEYMKALASGLRRRGVHIAVDTSGYAPWDRFGALLGSVDLWLYDLKLLSPGRHMHYTGTDNGLILSNLARLSDVNANIHLRVPVVPGANADDDEMRAMAQHARAHPSIQRVNLLPYHRLGQDKLPGTQFFEEPSPERMAEIAAIWRDAGFQDVAIGG